MTLEIKRCSKCVLPEAAPNITFDDQGVCNHCRAYQKISYKGETELLKILDAYRGTGRKYDCIVGMSGGRDSSCTLLKMVKDYDMKVLAVNYENPFTHPQAQTNIKNAVEALGVDLVGFKHEGKIHEKTFKNNLITWFQNPSPGMVPMICIGCKPLNWGVLKIARKNDIHLIVNGGNRFEDVYFKKELLGLSKDDRPEIMLTKGIFGILKGIFENPAYLKPRFIPTMVRGYLFGDPYAIGSRFFKRRYNVTWIDLFFFIEWKEQEILSRITSELGWDYPRDLGSWRFDCRVGLLKTFMLTKTIKMTERDDFFAKMIREGQVTRDDALQRLQKENELHMDKIQLFLNEQGIQDTSFLNERNDYSAV